MAFDNLFLLKKSKAPNSKPKDPNSRQAQEILFIENFVPSNNQLPMYKQKKYALITIDLSVA
jgi:hypothetical protein